MRSSITDRRTSRSSATTAAAARSAWPPCCGRASVTKVVCSFPRTANSTVFPELYRSGFTELELVPQGTLAERIRAGGAGIPAFYTPTAVGTPLGRRARSSAPFGGRACVLEHGITADFALIKARVCRHPRQPRLQQAPPGTSRRSWPWRPERPRSCRRPEIDEPAIDRSRVRHHARDLRRPRRRCPSRRTTNRPRDDLSHELVAARSVLPMSQRDHRLVAGGDGAPRGAWTSPTVRTSTSASASPNSWPSFVPEGRELIYHTENGLLGMGPVTRRGDGDPELINAGKRQVTAIPGAAYFHQSDSFAMIRGGHLDLCVLGALQVARNGDLANWSTGGPDAIPAVGGAMDLVAGVKSISVITQHCTKHGDPKLVEALHLPAHRRRCREPRLHRSRRHRRHRGRVPRRRTGAGHRLRIRS